MTVAELHAALKEKGISEDRYFLHGLYGSTDDDDKISLAIRRGKYQIEYETYFKERGEKQSTRVFFTESEACEYVYQKLMDEDLFFRIQKIEGLSAMTVNERLFASGLIDEFDQIKVTNSQRARKILRWLGVDEDAIERIVKQ